MNIVTSKVLSMINYSNNCFNHWRLSIFLFLAVMMGGTAQNVFTLKVPLYLFSVLFIVQALITTPKKYQKVWTPPVILGAILIGLYFLYLLPLPPKIWTQLEGRDLVVKSYELTQLPLPWLPLSLVPQWTFLSLFDFLPVIAIVVILRLSASPMEIRIAEKTLIFLALLSLIIGLCEVITGYHIYAVYNIYSKNFPIGVFSNINHQASLLAMLLPLTILHASYLGMRKMHKFSFFYFLAAVLLVLGLLFSRSTAGYLFLLLNLSISFFTLSRKSKYSKIFIIMIPIFIIAIIVDLIFVDNHITSTLSKLTSTSGTSRIEIYKTSIDVGKSFGFWGAGPGAFETVYKVFENIKPISPRYVNEAHNEFIQIWIELGFLGIFWILSCFVWFFTKIWALINSNSVSFHKQSFYALCILTPILHSIIDYPLRNISIAAVFTFLVIRFDGFKEQGQALTSDIRS